MPIRFDNDKGMPEFLLRVSAQDILELGVNSCLSGRPYAEAEHAGAHCSQEHQITEIPVASYQDAILCMRHAQDLFVSGLAKADLTRQDNIVPQVAQEPSCKRIYIPGPEGVSCRNRCKVDILSSHQGDGVLDTGLDILDRKIRVVVSDDCIKRQPFVDQLEHPLHCDPCTGNTGFSEMNRWIDHNSRLPVLHRQPPSLINVLSSDDRHLKVWPDLPAELQPIRMSLALAGSQRL